MSRETRLRPVQYAVIAWCLLSAVAALLPDGVGGPLRAVNAVLFVVLGPAAALAVFLRRTLPPAVTAVLCGTFSVVLLVLVGMGLLIVGLWSVPAAVALVSLVSLVTVALALWPSERLLRPAADEPAGSAGSAVPAEEPERALSPAGAATGTRAEPPPGAPDEPAPPVVMWS